MVVVVLLEWQAWAAQDQAPAGSVQPRLPAAAVAFRDDTGAARPAVGDFVVATISGDAAALRAAPEVVVLGTSAGELGAAQPALDYARLVDWMVLRGVAEAEAFEVLGPVGARTRAAQVAALTDWLRVRGRAVEPGAPLGGGR